MFLSLMQLKMFLPLKRKDFWEELTQEQRDEIEEGEKEIERGEYVDFYEFIKEHRSAKSNNL
ncbi:hypothetical protein [Flavobacterium piscinae]|uniref:hypothetical protein n=1 Tax=Flavobacterium piscinae TaxID=2506424 RepID=UPI002AAAB49F|nr:hypothetical protein [Flavobacterium piscinae]